MDKVYDAVIVGGGIGGAALAAVLADEGCAVALLERQDVHRDSVRGELLVPWGVAEARELGLGGCLDAAGAWTLRWWGQWDETVPADDAELTDLGRNCPAGVEGPVSLSHHRTCHELVRAARARGVDVHFGVRATQLLPDRNGVSCDLGGTRTVFRAGMTVGAGGRHGRLARQAGVATTKHYLHWGGGLAVEGLDDWPEDTQAMGTEGDVQFFVFPQGGGKARLYLNYQEQTHQRFVGRDGVRNFLQTFGDLRCLPGAKAVANTVPTAKLANFPLYSSHVDALHVPGVVLIGDEAGMNDTVLGTGLACAFRDARVLRDIVRQTGRFDNGVLDPYVQEREERMRRLNLCADLMARLYVEFGDVARERRRRALDLIRENPAHALFLLASTAGPERLPDLIFAEYLSERLLAA